MILCQISKLFIKMPYETYLFDEQQGKINQREQDKNTMQIHSSSQNLFLQNRNIVVYNI